MGPDRRTVGVGRPYCTWLVVSFNPSEKWWSEFVSWDDEIPNCFRKVIKFHGSSHHQPVTLDGLDGVFGGNAAVVAVFYSGPYMIIMISFIILHLLHLQPGPGKKETGQVWCIIHYLSSTCRWMWETLDFLSEIRISRQFPPINPNSSCYDRVSP